MSPVYFSAGQSCEGVPQTENSQNDFEGTDPPVSIRTRAILAARGLTLSEVARRSRSLFPDDNRFHIPPNLYHTIQHRGFSPSIHRLLALSRLSGYRLVDWLAIFGVVLDDIPRLQAILPARYTTLIDENVYDDQSWILSFEPSRKDLLPVRCVPWANGCASARRVGIPPGSTNRNPSSCTRRSDIAMPGHFLYSFREASSASRSRPPPFLRLGSPAAELSSWLSTEEGSHAAGCMLLIRIGWCSVP